MSKNVSKYKQYSDIEHILKKSDMWIGSTDPDTQEYWVYNTNSKQMVKCELTISPALYKIIDEILVNAYDRTASQLSESTTKIMISINTDENSISIANDGETMPVQIHPDTGLYVPEMVLANLRSSSNYDEDEESGKTKKKTERYTGGTYGIGAKATNIFSKSFIIEVKNADDKLQYKQVCSDNLSKISKPEIKKYTGAKSLTKITFIPDFFRFGMTELNDDIILLIEKRAYDIAMTCNNNINNNYANRKKKVTVTLDDEKLNVHTFKDYISLYTSPNVCVIEDRNTFWQVAATTVKDIDPELNTFQSISFVNGISTTLGGKHVDYIKNQIVKKLHEIIQKKCKDINIKTQYISQHLFLFINCIIDKPKFSSQTKTEHTTLVKNFGSTYDVTDDFIKKIMKQTKIYDQVLETASFKNKSMIIKTLSGSSSKNIGIIPKLDDANHAGKKNKITALILTEGDSAKAMAISGLSAIKNGRDTYGVFPLRGKLLNVREASDKQLMGNAEIQNLIKIIGLKQGKKYSTANIKELRYNHIIIFTDADTDGSHISGLIINFISVYWPELLEIDGFIQVFRTPIIKAVKGKKIISFFSMPEYHAWKETDEFAKGKWNVKYYKGLGTSTAGEAKQYFANLNEHLKNFTNNDKKKTTKNIELGFAKDLADSRKDWLLKYDPDDTIDYAEPNITYNDFINKELILHSNADNIRSIPNVIDGLKPSQRKIIYAAKKRNLVNEIKVSQFAGYVSEHTEYHHGEASLLGTIIGLAQNFIGSNNINYFNPVGQFGTRIRGGKDSASPRYIFTKLMDITSKLFRSEDDHILEYLDEDGTQIEPKYYVPVLPTLLINGTSGIGTGWSTDIPMYNPIDIINNIKLKISGKKMKRLKPWFRNHTGELSAIKGCLTKYVSKGIYQYSRNVLIINELPVGMWSETYRDFLDSLIDKNVKNGNESTESKSGKKSTLKETRNGILLSYKKDYDENHVYFELTLSDTVHNLFGTDIEGLLQVFKLKSSINISNMHAFNTNCKIHKYKTANDIINEFYDVRIIHYAKRKEFLLDKWNNELDVISEKVRFIMMIINNELEIKNVKKDVLNAKLEEHDFTKQKDSYDYLTRMPISTLTKEKVDELTQLEDEITNKIDILEKKTNEELWLDDLTEFEEEYAKFLEIKWDSITQ